MVTNLDPYIIIMLFVMGSIFGSFLNVVIYRVPLRMSIIAPRSHCFSCKTPIRLKDNIPIIGYLLLGGKCRDCGVPYSRRYPLVEFLTGLITLALGMRYGLSNYFIIFTLLSYCLIAIAFIDLDHMIIPNGFILLGLGAIVFIYFNDLLLIDWQDGATGALIFGGFLFVIGVLGEFILRKESIGLDLKTWRSYNINYSIRKR